MGISAEKLMSEMMGLSRESPGFPELLNKFGSKLKETLNADHVIIKDFYHGNEATQSEEFVINTKKAYLDNRLSGYSAFVDLINHFNSGFKSCLILPVASEEKILGTLTVLSKKEENFDKETFEILSLVGNLLGYESDAKIERERSISIARYFDAAFENLMPQFIIEKNGGIIKANKSAQNLLDKTSKEMTGSKIADFFNVDESSLEKLKKGIAMEIENKASTRKFRVSSKVINDNLTHLLFYETTTFRELETKEMFFGHSENDAFMLSDRESRIVWVSENIEKIARVDQDNFLGRKFTDFMVDSKAKEDFKGFDKSFKDFSTLKLGNDIMIDVSVSAFRNDSGFSIIISKNLDKYISNIKRSLDDVLKLSSDAVIIVDGMGYIKEINKSAEKLLGYRNDELRSLAVSSLYADEESKARLETSMNLAKASGIVTDLFVNFISSGGEQVPFVQNIRAIRDGENNLEGYMLVGKELSTKRLMDELQSKLEDIGKEAEKYKTESDLKTQFIDNVSHELKTPITNIIGFSKLLAKGEFGLLNDEQEKNIGIIIDEANRLQQLIQQILDVAKLSSGKIKLDIQKVNLKELGENPSIKSLAEVATNRGLDFSFNVDYNVPEVDADPNRLIQVFVNLIGNSIKFTEKGSIHVKAVRKGKSVRVEVTDTGIGISKEDKVRLFKRFYQLQKKGLTKQEGSGTGLGLSIVREIVNLHGGRVGVNSEPGIGSTFWFTLPIYGKGKRQNEN